MKRLILILLAASAWGQTYDTPGISAGGTTVNAPAAFASIPSCSTSIFVQPLNNSFYDFVYCDGSSALSYYLNGRRHYPVVDGDYSWDNQGTATISVTTGAASLLVPANASDNLRVRYKTAPSAPWTATVHLRFDVMNVAVHNAGLVFRQSSDGKLASCNISQASTIRYESNKWTNSTTFSANYASLDEQIGAPFEDIWLRVGDNSTNRTCEVSLDGINWRTVHSVGRTDFLTADQVGFYGNTVNATFPLTVTVLSWQEE